MEPASLLTPEITQMVTGFAGNIVPTVVALLAIIIPTGLTLWAMGFGVKKGISFLQRKARTAL